MELRKMTNESPYAYKWRVYTAKRAGLLEEIPWEHLADIINKELRPEEDPLDKSVYRKEAAVVTDWWKNFFASENMESRHKELAEEVRKQRVLLADERTANNRAIREAARIEHKLDLLGKQLEKIGKERFPVLEGVAQEALDTDNALLVLLSDLHIGACFANSFGMYDLDFSKAALERYMRKVCQIGRVYRPKEIYIGLLGDLISGNIHKPIAVQNQENVIEQIMTASDLIGHFIHQLLAAFPGASFTVVNVCGNHTRIEAKELALKDERLDALIPFILKKSLGHLLGLTFHDPMDSSIDCVEIGGLKYAFVHGDLDGSDVNSIARLGLFLGELPYAICCGHQHTPMLKEVNGVKVIQGGSLPGSGDDYTVQKRLYGTPCQSFLAVNSMGIAGHFPVWL